MRLIQDKPKITNTISKIQKVVTIKDLKRF